MTLFSWCHRNYWLTPHVSGSLSVWCAYSNRADQLNGMINCTGEGVPHVGTPLQERVVCLVWSLWAGVKAVSRIQVRIKQWERVCMERIRFFLSGYRLQSESHGSPDQLRISPPVRSIGQRVTEGERKEEKECVMDRDWVKRHRTKKMEWGH